MEKYTAPELELVVLKTEDIILSSDGGLDIPTDDNETPIVP